MQTKTILFLLSTISLIFCAYYPQLTLTLKPDLINKQLSINYGQQITDAINAYKIKDIDGETTISGVKAKYNLTNLKQLITINWKANVLKVKDIQTFNIHAKNVNLTLDGHLDLKIGFTRKQKGNLKILISQLQLSIDIKFVASPCSNGLGFGAEIAEVNLDIRNINIKIQGKAFDNLIIAEIQKLIIPRLPGIINKAVFATVNPLLQNLVCNHIQQKLPVGTQNYIVTINSTEVPSFKNNLQFLEIQLDLTFQNLVTNDTNDELQKDYLPQSNAFSSSSDAAIALSSNFLNTIIWLVGDSNILKLNVTNDMLGPSPPILLNTTNLSILMPKLKEKWPNKEVFLMIQTAGKYEHLLIRSGRIVTVINLAVKFVVNITQNPHEDADQCIKSKGCIIACNLNMTLPLSLSLRLNQRSAFGLLHTAQFYSIDIISSQIDINLNTLKAIINEIVGSMIPDLNNQLSTGFPLPEKLIKILQTFDISQIHQQIFLDFIAVGLKFDL